MPDKLQLRCNRCGKTEDYRAPITDFCMCSDDSPHYRAEAVVENAEYDAKVRYPDSFPNSHPYRCGYIQGKLTGELEDAYKTIEKLTKKTKG